MSFQSSSLAIAEQIRALAASYAERLAAAMARRAEEMEDDDCSHHMLYGALGISPAEGRKIDLHQNMGRFLYKYAGSLTEEAVRLCFQLAAPDAGRLHLPCTLGGRPKTFEIDCLLGNDAIELKWRDATTDGDHVAKERAKLRAVVDAGYTPVRLTFFKPSRLQAQRIQAALEDLYAELGGTYLAGAAAWDYVRQRTGVDLWGILKNSQLTPSAVLPAEAEAHLP
jgi:hypothetical protein